MLSSSIRHTKPEPRVSFRPLRAPRITSDLTVGAVVLRRRIASVVPTSATDGKIATETFRQLASARERKARYAFRMRSEVGPLLAGVLDAQRRDADATRYPLLESYCAALADVC